MLPAMQASVSASPPNEIAFRIVSSYEIELKRSLHCWDFFFIMKPIGYNKGFGLRISISEDKLRFKMTQSTMKGNWDS